MHHSILPCLTGWLAYFWRLLPLPVVVVAVLAGTLVSTSMGVAAAAAPLNEGASAAATGGLLLAAIFAPFASSVSSGASSTEARLAVSSLTGTCER